MTRHVTRATIYDAVGVIYTKEEADAIVAGYPDHERDARAKGIPQLGSGLIFPIDDAAISETQPDIPSHWPRIAGIDFGWDHPTAVVWVAWDRDADVVHIYDCYRRKEATPETHASAIKARGKWIPVAWPHDGNNDTAAGINLAAQYRDEDVNMLPERAKFEDGSHSVEAGLMEMLTRMRTGRLKAANHLDDWFDERRLYHRKDGKVVKEYDDLMSATRYALMCLRFAAIDSERMPDFDVRWVV